MQDGSSIPTKLLILIALLQGLILLILHQAIEFKFWPHNAPQWLFCFYSMAFVGPVMLLLALKPGRGKAIVQWVLPFTLMVGCLGYYVGRQAIPLAHVNFDTLLFGYVLTLLIATFKALMYVQHFESGKPLNYSLLFRWSWRNFLTWGLALLFTLCFWGLLMLWAYLFKAIKVDFFYDLFTENWFYYPALSLAHGFGIVIFRRQSNVIDTITRIQQALMKFLLVVLVLVSGLFISALPFTGLAPLWETGGSMLILWMQALMLFFVNAVYQDDPNSHPYSKWLHRFIYGGVALLPVYSAISVYGLILRVTQYGWTLDRCWAFLIWGLLALFSLGYLWGIFKRGDKWLHQLSWVNVRMGLVVLAALLVVNSPLLDFRKITVNSQLARLNKGAVTLKDFDYYYFRYQLAGPGYNALQQIKDRVATTDPEIVVQINALYGDTDTDNKSGSTQAEFLKAVNVTEGTIPESLGDRIYKLVNDNFWRARNIESYHLLPLDLDQNGETDYLFIEQFQHRYMFTLFYWENDDWQQARVSVTVGSNRPPEKLMEAINQGDVELVPPRWLHLKIGDYRLRIQQ